MTERGAAGSFRMLRLRGRQEPLLIGLVFFVQRPTGKGGWGTQSLNSGNQKRSRALYSQPWIAARRRWGTAAGQSVHAVAHATAPIASQAILDSIEVSLVA